MTGVFSWPQDSRIYGFDTKNKVVKVVHLSMECYPMAKVGGMGDVVGSLPLYQNQRDDVEAVVVLPKYYNSWVGDQEWETVHEGRFNFDYRRQEYEVQRLKKNELGYELIVIDLPGLFDRDGVYAGQDGVFFEDEVLRVLGFQIASLHWVKTLETSSLVVHCHDHHTGLVPFMMSHCYDFGNLASVPTLFTIHNGRYQGSFSWSWAHLIPYYDDRSGGLLDWDHEINSLASAIRCSWFFNTVSQGYLQELMSGAESVDRLIAKESQKAFGILNGIDTALWDPRKDEFLDHQLKKSVSAFKKRNKQSLAKEFGLDPKKPLFVFIGRLAHEKGADILPFFVQQFCSNPEVNFILLGSGNKQIEAQLSDLDASFDNFVACITYNEQLSHRLYASMDFLLMPSRVEPCGLNQMFAMRYASVPIVRRVGGLMDSVPDIINGGVGVTFEHLSLSALLGAASRAIELYEDEKKFQEVRGRCVEQNFSWESSTDQYISLYQRLLN